MNVLFDSASFWILFLTVLAVFLGDLYLTVLHYSFGSRLTNLSPADVLMRSLPILALLTVLVYFVATHPQGSGQGSPQEIANSIRALAGQLPLVILLAMFCAALFGKVHAWRIKNSKKRVDIYGPFRRDSVIILAFTKDFVSCYDPGTKKCYMIPWSGITHIETC